jgi:hypothetical protein
MSLHFINYSDGPLTVFPSFRQDGADSRGAKPNGLWLSVIDESGNDSWKNICRVKSIPLKAHATEIVLKPDAKILWLRDAQSIDALNDTHGYFPECRDFLKDNMDYTRSAIRWERVARDFDGVIAAPHCADRHIPEHWYYTWDCSSGCLWRPDPIAQCRPLSQPNALS